MQIFPERLRKLWSLWEMCAMVLSSLILQGILILFGNKRKYSTSKWLRVLWLAYLLADWVAAVSLSLLSSNLSIDSEVDSTNPDHIITAFWAPFLLLHLGGPDNITAYSLEDNELWWRHSLVLFVQVGLAIYVFLRAWDGHHVLNFLAIPMYVAGIIKFAERTRALRSASSKHLRESMFPRPDPGPDYARYMDEFRSKKDEGFEVRLGKVTEAPTVGDYSFTAPSIFPNAANLEHAYVFFKTFKCLFADLILSIHDILNSRSFFQNRSCDEAFKVVEVELGFMYDLFYTKAVLYTDKAKVGAIFRVISSVSIIYVAVHFSIIEKKEYKKENVIITYMLLAGAVILEAYAAILQLCSDWTMIWLSKHKKAQDLFYPVISYISLAENKRWSNVIMKYNLTRFCLQDKPANLRSFCRKVLWKCKKYKNSEEVPRDLKELIFQQLIQKSRRAVENSSRATELDEDCKKLCAHKGDWVLENEKCYGKLGWSIEEEFDHSILLWHIATDLCYYSDLKRNSNYVVDQHCKHSKSLSEYMLYLLVKRPFMLPNGIGQIRFQDTCAEATAFFKQRKCERDQSRASLELLEVNTEIAPAEVKGDRSKSVLFDACRLAKALQSLETEEKWENQKKWKLMSHVWVEMLSYAASQCRWNHHAGQLSRGGQLLTHVWLLMAHLGITEQFQTFKFEMAMLEYG